MVSALMPVLSDRKNTGTAGGSDVSSSGVVIPIGCLRL